MKRATASAARSKPEEVLVCCDGSSTNDIKSLIAVVRKWFNIKSRADEFHSDYATHGTQERRKSWSDKDRYVFPARDFSIPGDIKGWFAGAPENLKRHRVEMAVKDIGNLKMFVGTWNVRGKAPHGDLDLQYSLNTPTPADIYVLGVNT